MSYLRNPVYAYTGTDADDLDGLVFVSLPRGEHRSEPAGADFTRRELLALSLALLEHDFPEYVTEAGLAAGYELERQAQAESMAAWEGKAKRLERLPKRNLVALVCGVIAPEDIYPEEANQ